MRSHSRTSRYQLIHADPPKQVASFAEAVERGLTADPKTIPSRFLYDEAGSQLFEEICDLPEYYLTRVEHDILRRCAHELAAGFDGPITLTELGSGSSLKTRVLIEAFLRAHGRLRYVPVDISRSILEESAQALLDRYEALEVMAIASEYQEGLRRVRRETHRPKLIAWLGSSVGNLHRGEAARFLAGVRAAMEASDRILIGIDLRKEASVLEAAYDDAAGVTARFSLNLLERMNRELGARFDPRSFEHRAVYREEQGRVEIRIVSLEQQEVRLDALDRTVRFDAGEGIYTEDAYKYSPAEIDALARDAGLSVERRWLDERARFSVNLLAP